MADALKGLNSSELILIILVLGGIGKYVLDAYLDRSKQSLIKNSETVKEQTQALTQNTLAITKLEIQLEQLVDLIKQVPKLKEDVRVAFTKIKELENGSRRKRL